jgi:hypothetical protein
MGYNVAEFRLDYRQEQEILLCATCPDRLWGPLKPIIKVYRGKVHVQECRISMWLQFVEGLLWKGSVSIVKKGDVIRIGLDLIYWTLKVAARCSSETLLKICVHYHINNCKPCTRAESSSSFLLLWETSSVCNTDLHLCMVSLHQLCNGQQKFITSYPKIKKNKHKVCFTCQ